MFFFPTGLFSRKYWKKIDPHNFWLNQVNFSIRCQILFEVPWILQLSHPEFHKNVCVCVGVGGLSSLMTLCCQSPIWLGHCGCTRLRLLCTLTPAEVWSASWSKGKKTKPPTQTRTPSADRPQLAVTRMLLTSPHLDLESVPWGGSGKVQGYICDRWPSSPRFSHLSLTPRFPPLSEARRLECVAFLILSLWPDIVGWQDTLWGKVCFLLLLMWYCVDMRFPRIL